MKLLIATTLAAFALSSYAEPDEQGATFYTQNTTPKTSTASRYAKDWINHNLMGKPQAAKPAAALISQAGSFSTHERANDHAAWLKKNNNGARTRVERVSVNGAIRYRVFIFAVCGSFLNQTGCGCMGVAK